MSDVLFGLDHTVSPANMPEFQIIDIQPLIEQGLVDLDPDVPEAVYARHGKPEPWPKAWPQTDDWRDEVHLVIGWLQNRVAHDSFDQYVRLADCPLVQGVRAWDKPDMAWALRWVDPDDGAPITFVGRTVHYD